MGIYQLSIKNMRRNRLRNVSTISRITVGVIIFLVLISSGIGINSFLKQTSSLNSDVFSNNQKQSKVPVNVTSIISSITNYLNSSFGVNVSNSLLLSKLEGYITSFVYLLDGIASISFLVGVFGVINVLNLNLSERKREIGILKSLGFSKRQILISISLEAGLFGLLGSVMGVILGSIGIIFISKFLGLKMDIILPFQLVLGIITVTTILALFLGFIPAYYASKMGLEDALRYE
jgi:putative ABC transport system permease protein